LLRGGISKSRASVGWMTDYLKMKLGFSLTAEEDRLKNKLVGGSR